MSTVGYQFDGVTERIHVDMVGRWSTAVRRPARPWLRRARRPLRARGGDARRPRRRRLRPRPSRPWPIDGGRALVADIETLVTTSTPSPTGLVPIIPDCRSCSSGTRWVVSSPLGSPSAISTSSAPSSCPDRSSAATRRSSCCSGWTRSRRSRSIRRSCRGPGGRRRLRRRPARLPRTVPQRDVAGVGDVRPRGGRWRHARRSADAVDPRRRRPTRAVRSDGDDDGADQRHLPAPPAYDGAAHEVFNETNKDEVLGEVRTSSDHLLGLPPDRTHQRFPSSGLIDHQGWSLSFAGGGGYSRFVIRLDRTNQRRTHAGGDHVLRGRVMSKKSFIMGKSLGWSVSSAPCSRRATSPLRVWAWIETASAVVTRRLGRFEGGRDRRREPDVEPGCRPAAIPSSTSPDAESTSTMPRRTSRCMSPDAVRT